MKLQWLELVSYMLAIEFHIAGLRIFLEPVLSSILELLFISISEEAHVLKVN